MRVSETDLSVLIALRDDPLASYSSLGAKLDLAPNTIKSKIQSLKDDGILRKDGMITDPVLGKRKITETIAYINTNALGLKRLYFLLVDILSYADYEKIVVFLDNHPYTTFQVLCTGNELNIYVEFQIPESETQLLKKFLRKIRDMQLYKKMIYIDPVSVISGKDDLTRWDNYDLSWDLSIDDRSEEVSIKDLFVKYLNTPLPKQKPTRVSETKNIDPLNLKILRELTINGKASVQYLTEFYDKDRTTISRRIKLIRDKYVDHYSVIYNKKTFHLGSTFIIFGSINKAANTAVKQLITNNHIQFFSEFLDNDKQFIWRIDAPTIFVNALFRLIAPYCTDIGQLTVHTETNSRYFFYHLNYDEENKDWKRGEEYMVNEPLR
ncbi:MAG: Lrp/AsnC family transcriptional regulator [Candidatus Heimdallarchaeota archaeon]|nr:Lrp/AsnC family transcriptional regulator [Candidatus Heimdallarchaeota archaeon]